MLSVEQVEAAQRDAVCQRGPRKGRLKANCPPMGTLAAAYWQGVMIATNPFKVSIAQMIFFTPEQQWLFDLVKGETDKMVAKRRQAA